MEPHDRFITPRPAPPAPSGPEVTAGSLPSTSFSDTRSARSARSVSPAPRWAGAARRLFGLRPHSKDEDRGLSSRGSDSGHSQPELSKGYDTLRSATPTGSVRSVRSRDISPESLRRFLSDDVPFATSAAEPPPKLWIPDEIVEENEDDDNFATSAVSESAPVTMLSPPPARRNISTSPVSLSNNASTTTIVPETRLVDENISTATIEESGSSSGVSMHSTPAHTLSPSTPASPASSSSKSRDRSNYSFLDDIDDSDDDEDCVSNGDDFSIGSQPVDVARGDEAQLRPRALFTNYSLPSCHSPENGKSADLRQQQLRPAFGSPELIARNDNGVPVGNTHLLTLPRFDSGLDDLTNEISWIADVVRPKDL